MDPRQLKIFTIWIIIIILVYLLFRYLDISKDKFYNITNEGDYYVFNTRNDIDVISKNIKGSVNLYKPNLYLKLKGEKKFDISNFL